MKKLLLLSALSLSFGLTKSRAQVKVGDNPTTINANSILEIESTSKGMLLPRLTQAQRDGMTTVPEGMVIFNTTDSCINQYNRGAWNSLCETGEFCNVVMVTDTVDFDRTDPNGTLGTNEVMQPADPTNSCALYITDDGNTWIWNGSAYITKAVKVEPWWNSATKNQSENLTDQIYHYGSANIGTGGSALKNGYNLTVGNNDSIIGTGKYNIVTGANNKVQGSYSAVFGSNHDSVNNGCIVSGTNNNNIYGNNSAVFGSNHDYVNLNSIVAGNNNNYIYGYNSAVFGSNHDSVSFNSIVAGNNNNYIYGYNSAVFGSNHDSVNYNCIVAGNNNNNIYGYNSAVFGSNHDYINGNNIVAGDNHNNITGQFSAVFGQSNTTSGSYSLVAGNGSSVTGSYGIALGQGATAAANTTAIKMGSTTARFTSGATAWTFSSDRRLKKNIAPTTYGLNAVMGLKPVSYNLIEGNDETKLGFIAQDVQEVVPEVVTENIDKDGMMGVAYSELIPVLTKAIQELNAKIEALEKENATLTASLAQQVKELQQMIGMNKIEQAKGAKTAQK